MYENLSINQSKTEPAMSMVPSLLLFICPFLFAQQQIMQTDMHLS